MVLSLAAPREQDANSWPHILGIPVETRLTIYSYILDDIQNERRQWERNVTSTYDGLLLACRQLSHEASRYVFHTRITSYQTSKLTYLLPNMSTFFTLRSLSIEIDLELDIGDVGNLVKILDVFQLSLQELHLLFFGQDRHENEVVASGCANQALSHISSRPLLLESGQDVETMLNLLRMLIGCRNLRILRIENANLPLLPAIFMVNKPFLQAFSAMCDPRSITHQYAKWRHRRDVLRELLVKVDPKSVPPIRALHIDTNAVVTAEDIVQWLRATIEHLSWRVPNADFQGHPNRQNDFYDMTNKIFGLLWSDDRAPCLETLRLCCEMRDLPSCNPRFQWDIGHLAAALGSSLPRFQKLKHFELHYSGGDNFIRNELIESLPHGLQRLYITDMTIPAPRLVRQIRQRYFLSTEYTTDPRSAILCDQQVFDDSAGSGKSRIESLPLHELPNANFISITKRGQVQYLSSDEMGTASNEDEILMERFSMEESDYLDNPFMIGESCFRRDEIPLSTGKLGFVTFEYEDLNSRDDHDITKPIDRVSDESDRSIIFRLNGQLLDREHNLHLSYDQATTTEYGIKPARLCENSRGENSLAETETYSIHASIYAAVYNKAEFAPKAHLVQQNLKDLTACLQREGKKVRNDSMAWYFGNEDEAVTTFELEPVVKAEIQKQKSTIIEVEVRPSTRCRWMCPDFEVPPVGFFPKPTIPLDWKHLANTGPG